MVAYAGKKRKEEKKACFVGVYLNERVLCATYLTEPLSIFAAAYSIFYALNSFNY